MTRLGHCIALAALGIGSLAHAGPLSAQQDYDLPRWIRSTVESVRRAETTEMHEGPTLVSQDALVRGGLYVVEGTLTVEGVVEGDVVVVNGDLEFGPDGWVDGDATVLGGEVGDAGRVGGTTKVYRSRVPRRGERWDDRDWRDPEDHRARDRDRERLDPADRRWEDRDPPDRDRDHPDRDDEWDDRGWDDERRWRRPPGEDHWDGRRRSFGEAGIIGRVGPTFNRTEGLPIRLGPRFRVGGPAPLEVEALAILRTATSFDSDIDEFDDEEVGYSVRLEQRFGYDVQGVVGGRLFRETESIETWGLTDAETSLATFLLREDYRDYYDREGWSAFAGVRVPEAGLQLIVDYRDEEHAFRPVADPWTPFDRDDPWRSQPLVGEGDMISVGADLRIDLPDYYGPFGGGWSLRALARVGLDGGLVRPGHTSVDGTIVPSMGYDADDVRFGFVDLRRYNALGRNERIDLRFLAGGSLNGMPVPPQFQHAIGGVGSLPGHDLFIGDCGGRDAGSILARTSRGVGRQSTYSNYGCDRFLMFQAEYRGGVDFDFGWDGNDRDRNPDNWGNWEEWDRGRERFDADFEWSVFFDAGRGWTLGVDDPAVPRYDTDTLMDAGFGIWLGGVGILAAVPLDTDEHPLRWFVRLEHRF